MDGLVVQVAHHLCDVVFLKKANPGNASRPRIKAGASVLDRDPAEGKHWDRLSTSFTQSLEACGACLRGILLFKDGSEDGEVSAFGRSLNNLIRETTRNADQCASTLSAANPNFLYFRW
jgi:hypothetical protein